MHSTDRALDSRRRPKGLRCCFDGVEGRVRPNYKRAVPLAFLLLRLVGIGRATSDLLDSEQLGQFEHRAQRLLGTYLGSELRPGYGYLQSALNPSDDRTRETELRVASREPSTWFQEFLNGDLRALQDFLHNVGLSDAQIRGLPDPREIKFSARKVQDFLMSVR